ncbi:hypothetical protein GCM10009840_21110 [Pseudolysinimonas kribbensis]|uniref:Uncharacterized protein n=1 Tax=Pseudolysinimonas kribbensis TaxID=433641 RepID=A0ABQ6KG74_9MICO|nr:hypothetical protein [Pseudolysinimonas kribbensis]GMA93286.1 hypothetical protein GCM10025881_01100 [Pseudolysinimonas kribbensis]GMA97187.1 hypothetical protein GCM10025881_40110 [Pseudolysinimonas kribbensis]
MAIKRNFKQHPLVILDALVLDVDRDLFEVRDEVTRQKTGEVIDKGRVLTVQTAGLRDDAEVEELVVKVPNEFDSVEFEPRTRVLVLVDYNEWDMQGRRGTSMKFAGFVSPSMVSAWATIAQSQTAAVPA